MSSVISEIKNGKSLAEIAKNFALSTYNTDYILIKATNFEKDINILSDAEYQVI